MTKNNHFSITDQEVEKATKEYRRSLGELHDIENEKKKIISDYLNELEQQKIQQLRSSI